MMVCSLGEAERETHHVKRIPVVTGDRVRVMVGNKRTVRGQEGKVTRVCRRKFVVYIEEVKRSKSGQSGNTVQIPFHPSNLQIVKLKTNKGRTDIIKRKREAAQNDPRSKAGMEKMD